jgi:hypothetical protein
MASLYETWLNRIDSYYEEQFFQPVVEALCQYRGGTTDGRIAKGKSFNAGYEVFIYAFFLGLYYGERKPLVGEKRKFRMEMSSWGRKKNEEGRKSYTILQKYIFAALVAKSDVDLIALDHGRIGVDEVCDVLMTTLNEYANAGFYLMRDQMAQQQDCFFENSGLLQFIRNFCAVG